MQSWPNPMPLAAENQRVQRCEGPYRFDIENLSSGRGGPDVDHECFTLGEFLDLGLLLVFACGFDAE